MIELLNCDCMDYMAGLPDNAFELAIVDPPYGIGAGVDVGNTRKRHNKKVVHEKKEWDKCAPSAEYFCELFRVSSDQIIFGANYYPQHLKPSRGWISWFKQIGGCYGDCELAYTSFDRTQKHVSIWCETGGGAPARIHPTQKPVALYEWLLTNYAKPGDRILDTHLGSGSSAIAAHNLGFDFVGMELDPDYYQAAIKRFEQHKAQARLFDCDDYQRTERDYQQDRLL